MTRNERHDSGVPLQAAEAADMAGAAAAEETAGAAAAGVSSEAAEETTEAAGAEQTGEAAEATVPAEAVTDLAAGPEAAERAAASELAAHPADAEMAADLRLVLMRLVRRLRREAGNDLSGAVMSALASVERNEPVTLGELAAIESVKPPNVSRMVATLEGAGLVRRRPDDSDRRVARLSLTPAGRRMLQRTRTRKTAYLARRVRRLNEADRAALRAAMPILQRLLEDEES